MYVCTYVCMYVRNRASLYVYSMYVCMCVCRHSHVWHRQYAHHICSSMYVQTATIKNTTLRNILLHSWSKYFFWCVMQIVDCGDAHMQRLFVICTCFQDMQPVQGRAFHGRCSIGPGTNMYTHRSARHRCTTWSDDIFMWYRLPLPWGSPEAGVKDRQWATAIYTHVPLTLVGGGCCVISLQQFSDMYLVLAEGHTPYVNWTQATMRHSCTL